MPIARNMQIKCNEISPQMSYNGYHKKKEREITSIGEDVEKREHL